MSSYQYLHRSFNENIILLPGWATDYKIFESLDIDFNYFLPINFNPYNFEHECLDLLKENNLKKISLFGWSLGGNVAAKFAIKYPELIEKIIVVSVKTKYETDGIEKIKSMLRRNKNAYLLKFYQQCFSDDDNEEYAWFKNNLQKYYLNKFKTEKLIKDLDFLLNNPIDLNQLKRLIDSLNPTPYTLYPIPSPLPNKITFLHGDQDRIVPVADIHLMKSLLPHAEYKISKNSGHLPFL